MAMPEQKESKIPDEVALTNPPESKTTTTAGHVTNFSKRHQSMIDFLKNVAIPRKWDITIRSYLEFLDEVVSTSPKELMQIALTLIETDQQDIFKNLFKKYCDVFLDCDVARYCPSRYPNNNLTQLFIVAANYNEEIFKWLETYIYSDGQDNSFSWKVYKERGPADSCGKELDRLFKRNRQPQRLIQSLPPILSLSKEAKQKSQDDTLTEKLKKIIITAASNPKSVTEPDLWKKFFAEQGAFLQNYIIANEVILADHEIILITLRFLEFADQLPSQTLTVCTQTIINNCKKESANKSIAEELEKVDWIVKDILREAIRAAGGVIKVWHDLSDAAFQAHPAPAYLSIERNWPRVFKQWLSSIQLSTSDIRTVERALLKYDRVKLFESFFRQYVKHYKKDFYELENLYQRAAVHSPNSYAWLLHEELSLFPGLGKYTWPDDFKPVVRRGFYLRTEDYYDAMMSRRFDSLVENAQFKTLIVLMEVIVTFCARNVEDYHNLRSSDFFNYKFKQLMSRVFNASRINNNYLYAIEILLRNMKISRVTFDDLVREKRDVYLLLNPVSNILLSYHLDFKGWQFIHSSGEVLMGVENTLLEIMKRLSKEDPLRRLVEHAHTGRLDFHDCNFVSNIRLLDDFRNELVERGSEPLYAELCYGLILRVKQSPEFNSPALILAIILDTEACIRLPLVLAKIISQYCGWSENDWFSLELEGTDEHRSAMVPQLLREFGHPQLELPEAKQHALAPASAKTELMKFSQAIKTPLMDAIHSRLRVCVPDAKTASTSELLGGFFTRNVFNRGEYSIVRALAQFLQNKNDKLSPTDLFLVCSEVCEKLADTPTCTAVTNHALQPLLTIFQVDPSRVNKHYAATVMADILTQVKEVLDSDKTQQEQFQRAVYCSDTRTVSASGSSAVAVNKPKF